MGLCYCKRCIEYETSRSTPKNRVALLGKYKKLMKSFNSGDIVRHRDFPKRTGIIICRVRNSYFYYVRLGQFTFSMNADHLKIVKPATLSIESAVVDLMPKQQRRLNA